MKPEQRLHKHLDHCERIAAQQKRGGTWPWREDLEAAPQHALPEETVAKIAELVAILRTIPLPGEHDRRCEPHNLPIHDKENQPGSKRPRAARSR